MIRLNLNSSYLILFIGFYFLFGIGNSARNRCKSDANIRCKFSCSSRRTQCQCGLDGNTYKNYCEMRCSAHLADVRIFKSHRGPCSKDCEPQEFENFKLRFVEWFDLAEKQMLPSQYNRVEEGIAVQEVLKVMFHTLDTNFNMVLEWQELKGIAEIPWEHCAAKFYRLCDVDDNMNLSFDEWGECFDQHIQMMPCDELQAKAFAARLAGSSVYYPSCTAEGYCLPVQCDEDLCWCTTPSCVKDPRSFGSKTQGFNCNDF